jgi:hypothetical protein
VTAAGAADKSAEMILTPRESFAMIPSSWPRSDLTDGEFRALCIAVDIQGAPGPIQYNAFGQNYIAQQIGKQSDTVARYMTELERRKLISIVDDGNGKKQFRVDHNPSWVSALYNGHQTHVVENVILGTAKLKRGATAKARREAGESVPVITDEHRARRNERDRARRMPDGDSDTSPPANGTHATPSTTPDQQDPHHRPAVDPPPMSGTPTPDERDASYFLLNRSESVVVDSKSRVVASASRIEPGIEAGEGIGTVRNGTGSSSVEGQEMSAGVANVTPGTVDEASDPEDAASVPDDVPTALAVIDSTPTVRDVVPPSVPLCRDCGLPICFGELTGGECECPF